MASSNLLPFDWENLSQLDFNRANERVIKSGFFWEYYAWEVALRNHLMVQRAKSVGQHAAVLYHGGLGNIDLAVRVEQILQQNPLAIEQSLDRLRWAKLNEFAGTHLFDMIFLAVYLLKLKILERSALWQEALGKEAYENICAEIIEKVGEI